MVKDKQINNNNHFPRETLGPARWLSRQTLIATQALEPEFHARNHGGRKEPNQFPKVVF